MGIETISEEGSEDYEIWTCDKCNHTEILNGVGGDVAECYGCLTNEYAQEAEAEAEAELRFEQKLSGEKNG